MANKITTLDIGGQAVDVSVYSNGKFCATFLEEEFEEKTLDELKAKLERAHREKVEELAIPVSVVDMQPTREKSRYGRTEPYESGRGVVHAVLRGKHARLGHSLLTSEEGKKFQIERYRKSGNICRRLTDNEVEDYTRLFMAADNAAKALEQFIEERSIDVDEVLSRKAVNRG
jgi:hypothetical protein